MSSDALFSLFSPVQNILFQNQHSTAWHGAQAQSKTVPEGTGARRGAGRGEGLHGGPSFLFFLCALGALCAKKILATMRDSDGQW
jgi:hypothetical protein